MTYLGIQFELGVMTIAAGVIRELTQSGQSFISFLVLEHLV